MEMAKNVYIYADEGVSQMCLKETCRSMQILKFRVSLIKHDEFFKLTKDDILVMPGGRDLPYLNKIGEEGCDIIRKFVEKGGTYIGFCAGAYFACEEVQFEIGTSQEVKGNRPLGFFPGTGYGTLYPDVQFVYNSEAGSHASLIEPYGGHDQFYAYYNGGCTFLSKRCKEELHKNINVLAVYKDISNQPPAIIQIQHGSGNVLLSGISAGFCRRLINLHLK